MAEPHGTVLIVDADIGFLLVLAQELGHRGIGLIPSGSVRQARSMLVKLKPRPTIDVLIINCRLSGVCALATEMVQHNAKVEVIGLVSGNHQCSTCRKLLTMVSQDPEVRDVRWIRKWGSIIQGRLSHIPKLAVITDSRHSKS